MPIYEYQCRECDHRLEKLQKISDAPLTDCPACSRPALVKLISAAAFRLKGGGWYETDFKKDGKRNLAGDTGGSESAKPESDKADKSDKVDKSGNADKAGKTDKPAADTKTGGSTKSEPGSKSKPAATGAAA